ncbi:hypothetical protein BDZ91DRAFT_764191 [Kalaharituber pfeilii]|nr:hypothetical protein BDZ91DRAFT_764191 [Kalaharituber pfeilii]
MSDYYVSAPSSSYPWLRRPRPSTNLLCPDCKVTHHQSCPLAYSEDEHWTEEENVESWDDEFVVEDDEFVVEDDEFVVEDDDEGHPEQEASSDAAGAWAVEAKASGRTWGWMRSGAATVVPDFVLAMVAVVGWLWLVVVLVKVVKENRWDSR